VLERVERGHVGVGDPQRRLEAAQRMQAVVGAPEQLTRAVHRVGAGARRAVLRQRREPLERGRRAREVARALGELGEQPQRLAAELGRGRACELLVLDDRPQRADRERGIAGPIAGDREPVAERAELRRLGSRILDQPAIGADHVRP
jgi:hypothetical protein